MLHPSRLTRLCAAALLLGSIPFIGTGCSRAESVKFINHFGQPIQVRLDGRKLTPGIPAHREAIFNGDFYVGGSMSVTVLTEQGRLLKKNVCVCRSK